MSKYSVTKTIKSPITLQVIVNVTASTKEFWMAVKARFEFKTLPTAVKSKPASVQKLSPTTAIIGLIIAIKINQANISKNNPFKKLGHFDDLLNSLSSYWIMKDIFRC